jgi:hypothetical protein
MRRWIRLLVAAIAADAGEDRLVSSGGVTCRDRRDPLGVVAGKHHSIQLSIHGPSLDFANRIGGRQYHCFEIET